MTVALDSIRFCCPTCDHAHRVPADYEGRKGCCSRCKTVLRVRRGVAELYRSKSGSRVRPRPEREDDDYGWSSENVHRSPRSSRRAPTPSASRPVALIAAIALCSVGFAAAVTGAAVSFMGTSDPLAAIPHDVDVVMQVDYQQLLTQLELAPLLEEQRQAAIDAVGIDPVDDIRRIYVASDLEQAQAGDGEGVLILVEGDFDIWSMQSKIEQQAMKFEAREYCGVDYLVTQGLPRPMSMCMLDSNLLAIGTEREVQDAIDTHQGVTPSVRDHADLAPLVTEVEGSLVWCAMNVPNDGKLGAQAQGLKSFVLSADHDGQVLGVLASMRFEDAEAASAVQEQIEQALGGLDEQLASAPLPISAEALGETVVGKSISRSGQTLTLSVELDTHKVLETAQQGGL